MYNFQYYYRLLLLKIRSVMNGESGVPFITDPKAIIYVKIPLGEPTDI